MRIGHFTELFNTTWKIPTEYNKNMLKDSLKFPGLIIIRIYNGLNSMSQVKLFKILETTIKTTSLQGLLLTFFR